MPNHKAPISERMKCNRGEEIAIEYFKRKDIEYDDFGWRYKDDTDTRKSLPKNIRSMPDFILYVKPPIFIECKHGSIGNPKYNPECDYPHVKLKLNDLEAYRFWDKIMKVYLLVVWRATNLPYNGKISLRSMFNLIDIYNYNDKILKYKNEGEYNQEFYPISLEHLLEYKKRAKYEKR